MESLPKRYGEALYDLAVEQAKVKEYRTEAKKIYASLDENPEMVHFLSSYFLTGAEKSEAVDKIYASISLTDLRSFIKVICENGRAYMILPIMRQFLKMADREMGIATGVVFSTEPMKESELKEVEKAISKKTGLNVELTNEIDKSLLGGIKVVINDKVLDGSLSSALNGLKESIMREGK